MLYHRSILSLSIITALSMSSQAFAFRTITPYSYNTTTKNIITVNNETLEDSAKKFISGLTEKGIGILKIGDESEDLRKREFKELLHNNFDMKTIARFALGRYWRTITKEEQKEYLKLFENMIVEVYSKRFSDYNGQKIDIISARPEGRADAIVSSVITPENGSEINVDWRVRRKKDGQLKVIDIVVEGVSMSLTQRSDFASVIQRGGGKVEVLLAHLRH